MENRDNTLMAGVIEGFYGQPWSATERAQLFDWISGWGLNTYLYAPKDDLKHRALWRDNYSAAEAGSLGALIQSCAKRNLRFIYALSPGLDICFSDPSDTENILKRFEQMLALGCRDFALLFDDIPDRMSAADRERWDSFASAQCHVTNAVFQWVRARHADARFLFCPTPYCGRMAAAKLGGEHYLPTIGRELLPQIDVFWTGPEIISREITVASVRELQTILRRKPVIWDNLHANDYDGRRFFCGPYEGRPPELRGEVRGLLLNPNNEFPLNYIPLRTLSGFLRCDGGWNAREAYLAAMREWLSQFATVGEPIAFEDLVLFGDCHYLPHEEGPEAEALFETIRALLERCQKPITPARSPSEVMREADLRQRVERLRSVCSRLAGLRDRQLFYALYRRAWELKEEIFLLQEFVTFKSDPANVNLSFTSDFHAPRTYRGGLVARLQRLLIQHPDGTFTPR